MPEFLPHLAGPKILAALMRAPGNEIKSGKFDHPDSSQALVSNAFGFFIDRPEALPSFPGLGGNPAYAVTLEAEMRFPWDGGRHPWVDVALESESLLIGVEARRYEPFRPSKASVFPEGSERPVWGARMGRYTGLASDIASGAQVFDCLDAVALIKAACGIRTQAFKRARQPVLAYIYAEPEVWSGSGKAIDPARIAQHRVEIDRFGDLVLGDHVVFLPLRWEDILAQWSRKASLQAHVAAVAARFGALG